MHRMLNFTAFSLHVSHLYHLCCAYYIVLSIPQHPGTDVISFAMPLSLFADWLPLYSTESGLWYVWLQESHAPCQVIIVGYIT